MPRTKAKENEMSIEKNKDMVAMLMRAKGQLEHKIRTAYNAGYKDGLKDGAGALIDKLAKVTEEKK